jgi:hypothetical protein
MGWSQNACSASGTTGLLQPEHISSGCAGADYRFGEADAPADRRRPSVVTLRVNAARAGRRGDRIVRLSFHRDSRADRSPVRSEYGSGHQGVVGGSQPDPSHFAALEYFRFPGNRHPSLCEPGNMARWNYLFYSIHGVGLRHCRNPK